MTHILEACTDGAIASCTALIVSNPFDVMRTRFQIQGEMMKRGSYVARYKNLPQGMALVAKEEGVLALQKGFCAAALWQITQNGIRIGMYPIVRDFVTRLTSRSHFLLDVLSAALCGVVGAVVSSPFVMLKTQLQADSVSSQTANSSAPKKGMWSTFRSIYRKGGVRGMWRGVTIAAQRTAVFSFSQLVSYDCAKRQVAPYCAPGLPTHIVASTISSFCIVLCTSPFDVVMTRSYNRRGGAGPSTNNTLKLLWEIYKVEGVHGLYKGSTAMFSRTAPHTIVTFVTLEYLKSLKVKTPAAH
ncbi:Mitochondrial carrier protein, putative [Angomonas deanei]|uniref:Mitochondrial carrier protein, putative n=1 Tax=Angomonas deanei TaxID=59799 RepID=A0A7G2C3A4_9TRYP|nr:Mitochondrial carrier protein, putative [Angomonas deanei]